MLKHLIGHGVRSNTRVIAVLVLVGTCLGLSWVFSIGRPPRLRFPGGGSTGAGQAGDGGDEAVAKDTRVSERDLRRALQYEGSGERIQRFIAKAREGKGVTVAVIGGSVSKGRGLAPASSTAGAPTLYSPENMHSIVYNWIDRKFPSEGNKLVNGAQGGVGAGYYSWCFAEHIPVDVDLILLELGINDVLSVDTFGVYEDLIRGLLQLPNQPAIINLEVFTPLFSTLMSSSALHQDVLAYYDVPSLAIRDVLLPRLSADPNAEMPRWYRTDPSLALDDTKVREWGGEMVDLMHLSALGHALAAHLVIAYLDRERRHVGWWRKVQPRLTPLPDGLLTSAFDPLHAVPHREPTCRSINANDQGVGLQVDAEGWEEWQWKEKMYLVAQTPGAQIDFDIDGAHTVAVAYMRSKLLGLGTARCWVDDDDQGVLLDGYWDVPVRNMVVVSEVARDLSPGPHTLHCESVQGEFRMVAYMHD